VLIIPMIETQEAIDNIDAILDVPGVSGIYVGPSDLGLSLGLVPKLDREEPQILKIYEKLTAACKKRGLFAGIHNGTPTYAARAFGMGFQLCTIANDSGLLAQAAKAAVNGFRKEVGASADK
jgi:4-hydroxy-2-oxoheptanedioate aldolase